VGCCLILRAPAAAMVGGNAQAEDAFAHTGVF